MENKNKFIKVLILAVVVILIFLIVNTVLYANGSANIYSLILEKAGTSKEYEETKTDINQVVEKNGVKLTLMDVAYDTKFLIMSYMFETENLCQKTYDLGYYQIDPDVQNKEEVIENMLQTTAGIYFQAQIVDGENKFYIGNYTDSNSGFKLQNDEIDLSNKIQTSAKVISKDKLALYMVVDISKYTLSDIINIEIIVKNLGMQFEEAQPPIFEGEWNFTVNNLNKGLTEIEKNYEK